ncbi:uncharacterized protein LOC132266770 [Cornus florida]|uniref:uncharacterized protein LOC132266770 n=1 Tax=Cornus florida TaxID=4283 RepID=UPI0028977BD8|nr:uncharacterized protein LOC132266770 [Cornus florida]
MVHLFKHSFALSAFHLVDPIRFISCERKIIGMSSIGKGGRRGVWKTRKMDGSDQKGGLRRDLGYGEVWEYALVILLIYCCVGVCYLYNFLISSDLSMAKRFSSCLIH